MNFQNRTWAWLKKCFGDEAYVYTKEERCARVIEEFAELMQALDYPADQVLLGVSKVYARSHSGEVEQEIGGVYVTLAALCATLNVNGEALADLELSRVEGKIPEIREKNRVRRFVNQINEANMGWTANEEDASLCW